MKQLLFLEALKASLKNEKVNWAHSITPEEWAGLFELANIHHVLPMVYTAVYDCPAAKQLEEGFFLIFRQQTMHQVMLQAMKTDAFLQLYQHLRQADLSPILFKGLICRELYPNPDYRSSSDEDLLIPPEDFESCHAAMCAYGMTAAGADTNLQACDEMPYVLQGSPLYIELHKYLFSPESEAYGDLNQYFAGVHKNAITLHLSSGPILAMDHTSHFFYLICHALKHFLHSGFGIRQVCDICLYANVYGHELDWQHIYDNCKAIHAERFTAAVLKIAEKYLTFSPETACYPSYWRAISVDEAPMLEDLLSGGVYGHASLSRKHSSNMTLDAVAAQKQRTGSRDVLHSSLFPSAKKLAGKYPYLNKYPILLPAAWISRFFRYFKETTKQKDSSAMETLQIGKDRIALIREYGILP